MRNLSFEFINQWLVISHESPKRKDFGSIMYFYFVTMIVLTRMLVCNCYLFSLAFVVILKACND